MAAKFYKSGYTGNTIDLAVDIALNLKGQQELNAELQNKLSNLNNQIIQLNESLQTKINKLEVDLREYVKTEITNVKTEISTALSWQSIKMPGEGGSAE